MPQSTQTVVVENPMSMDESGKLVNLLSPLTLSAIYLISASLSKYILMDTILQVTNVVVGVTTDKKT